MKKKLFTVLIVLVFIISVNVIGLLWFRSEIRNTIATFSALDKGFPTPDPNLVYQLQNVKGMKTAWEIKDIYSEHKSWGPYMMVRSGNVFLFGSTKPTDDPSVIMISAATGQVLWKSKPVESGSFFTADDTSVYIGVNSTAVLSKIQNSDHALLWEQDLGNIHGPCCFYLANGQLQTDWSPDQFIILSSDDGKVQQTYKALGNPVFRIEDDIAYLRGGTTTLIAESLEKGKLWKINIPGGFWQEPIFGERMIFLRSGRNMGSIYAIDRATGKELWHSEDDVISNLALSQDRIYFFTQAGLFKGVDIHSGVVEVFAELKSKRSSNPDILSAAYEVAFDNLSNTAFLLLGDSTQLIALKVIG